MLHIHIDLRGEVVHGLLIKNLTWNRVLEFQMHLSIIIKKIDIDIITLVTHWTSQ